MGWGELGLVRSMQACDEFTMARAHYPMEMILGEFHV